MRGSDDHSEGLFSYVSCEARVPANHPVWPIRAMVDEALEGHRQLEGSVLQTRRSAGMEAAYYRAARAQAFVTWAEIAGARLAA